MGFRINGDVLEKFEGYDGNITDIVVPDGIRIIGDSAFRRFGKITSVVLPETIEEIGGQAFEGCSKLENINFPNGIKRIGYAAFKNCSVLEKVMLPSALTELDNSAFDGCACEELLISGNITYIGWNAFAHCNKLKKASLSEGVQVIGNEAFAGCKELEEVFLPEGIVEIRDGAFSGCEKLVNIEIPESVQTIGNSAFSRCFGLADKDGFVIVRDVLYGYCGNNASVFVPQCITRISDYAFAGNTILEEVNLPNGVKEIGSRAFEGCSKLKKLHIPDSVNTIGTLAFLKCYALEKIEVNEGNTVFIGKGNCLLKEMELILGCKNSEIPNDGSVTTISAYVFCGEIGTITIPETVTQISEEAFSFCHNGLIVMMSATIKLENLDLGQADIWAPNKTYTDMPAKHRMAAARGFMRAFAQGLPGADEAKPSYLAYIKKQRKQLYPDLFKTEGLLTFMIQERIIDEGSVDELIKQAEKIGAVEKTALLLEYKSTFKPKKKKKEEFDLAEKDMFAPGEIKKSWQYEKIDGGIRITGYKGQETEVTIPERVGKEPVIAIGDSAFSPVKLRISSEAYNARTNLVKVVIPNSVKLIDFRAFEGCRNLTAVVIPESVEKVEGHAFRDCVKLADVSISPETKLTHSFAGCTLLEDKNGFVVINGVLDSVRGETKLKIKIPKNVKEIGSDAFQGCYKLTEIHVHKDVTVIRGFDVRSKNNISRNKELTIYAPAGSYAEQYAKEYGYNFIAE